MHGSRRSGIRFEPQGSRQRGTRRSKQVLPDGEAPKAICHHMVHPAADERLVAQVAQIIF